MLDRLLVIYRALYGLLQSFLLVENRGEVDKFERMLL
jgi:hypothetical protein